MAKDFSFTKRIIFRLFRHKALRTIWQIFSHVLSYPLFLAGFLIPKDPTLWIFANTYGFKDNARYLFEYVAKEHSQISPVWISTWNQHDQGNLYSYPRFSLKGIWLQYRASVAFVSTGQGDVARFTLARTKLIQLWHGIPIKHILLDSPESLPLGNKHKVFSLLVLQALKYNLRRYTTVIASSSAVQYRLCSAFGLPKKKVPITGYPRHDILLENSSRMKKKIIYAPTWRTDINQAYAIVHAICSTAFLSAIIKLNYELCISIHPLNNELNKMLPDAIINAVNIVQDEDINLLLAESEILITDYSSIAIDFFLLERQVIFYTPDRDTYLQDRGIYEEFTSIILEYGVTTAEKVLQQIIHKETRTSLPPDFFFQYKDTNSRKRIVDLVRMTSSKKSIQQVT